MFRFHFAAACAASVAALAMACTATTTTTTEVTQDDAGTKPPKTSSGGSSGKTSSSGGSTSSSSSSGGSTSSSSGGSTSSSGGSSGTSSSGGSSGTAKDAGIDATDAGPDPLACPQNVPLTPADLDAEIGWKPAASAPGSCSAADITTLQNNFSNPAIATYFDLANGLSASCKACVVSTDTSATWQPIVGTAADNGATGFINFGACFGQVESTSCGKALQYEQFCYNIACNECTTTAAERQQCIGKAGDTGGMCSGFGNTTGFNCPNIATSAVKCNTVFDAVKTLCGS